MPNLEQQLVELERRLQDDRISYLLIQFVDIHGAPKVKLVPAADACARSPKSALVSPGARSGAWGKGLIPMICRPDPISAAIPFCRTSPVSRGSRLTFTSTASRTHIVLASTSNVMLAAAQSPGLSFQRRDRAGILLGDQKPGRHDPRLGPRPGRRPRQALLRLQGNVRRARSSARAQRRPDTRWAGASTSPTTRTPTSSTKSTFAMPRHS